MNSRGTFFGRVPLVGATEGPRRQRYLGAVLWMFTDLVGELQ